jgi:hypothetical protein
VWISQNAYKSTDVVQVTITDLLEQGVPLEDVQRLAGHADPRTTGLYDGASARSRGISSRGFPCEVFSHMADVYC